MTVGHEKSLVDAGGRMPVLPGFDPPLCLWFLEHDQRLSVCLDHRHRTCSGIPHAFADGDECIAERFTEPQRNPDPEPDDTLVLEPCPE